MTWSVKAWPIMGSTVTHKSLLSVALIFSYLSCWGLRTVSISGCLKWLHTVLGNLLKLPKAVAYHFHKRLHTTLGNLVRLDKLCNLGQSAPIAIGVEFPDATKILSQLAHQAQKIKNRPGGFGSHLRDFEKLRQQNFTAIPWQSNCNTAMVSN